MKRLAAYTGLVVLGLYVVMFFAQAGVIFESDRKVRKTPEALGWKFEEVRVPVGRETTFGWFIPAENERGVVLVCHGNGGNMGTHLSGTRQFHNLGFSILLFDYGGFGKSTGNPSERRCYADAEAMWRYLVQTRGVSRERILVWGGSFGGGTACELARRVQPRALILQSTFLSMAKAAFGERWGWAATPFLRHRFNNEKKITDVHCPVLIIHSRGDTLYPFSHGEKLFQRANEPKRFIEIQGDHYGWEGRSNKGFVGALESFLAPLFPRQDAVKAAI
jgi:fermentation-respiration switch protein FrsA (DUF1100 family)